MTFLVAYLLIVGGVCACAPLFQRIAKFLGRSLSIAGFFVGIAIIIVAADTALGLGLFGLVSPSVSELQASPYPYLVYFLPLTIALCLLLVSRPIRNIRWASLISLAAGLLAAYYLNVFVPGLGTTVLAIVFLIATVIVYALLRFVEDIFEFVGTVLAFPPIAIAIGLVAIYFGILIWVVFPS